MNYCSHCMAELPAGAALCPACGTPVFENHALEHQLPPGTLLKGRFLIGDVLGEGGFGITYIARDLQADAVVAIKEYYPRGFATRSGASDLSVRVGTSEKEQRFFQNGKDKFLKEAQTLALLAKEPGIVQVRNFFQCNNTAYIVMEFLRGQTLRDYLKQHGTLSAREAYGLLLPIMRSLGKVHKKDVIHRDISPDNIMLAQNGVKLLDFGAARESLSQNTHELTVMMKPGYTPEEQYSKRGKQGPWTDIYALCATIYKCITGKTPLDAISRRTEAIKLPSELGARIDKSFEAVLMKGLAVAPEDRYQSMEALMADFDRSVGTLRPTVMPQTGLGTSPLGGGTVAIGADSGTHATVLSAEKLRPQEKTPQKKTGGVAKVLSILLFLAVLLLSALMVVQYQKLRTVSADLSSAVSENLSLQADLSDLEGENKSNSKKLNDANEKLQSENAALREENESYAAAQSELEDAKSELSSENEDLSSQVAALEDQMDAGALLDEDAWNAVVEFQRYSSNDTHRAHVIPGKNILILKAGSSTSVTLYHNYEGTVGFHLSYNHDVATAEMQEGDAGTYRLTVEGVAHGTTTLTMTNDTDDEVVSILIVVV